MKTRNLAYGRSDFKSGADIRDHVLDILPLLHKAKSTVERDGRDYVESVPLEPGTEVNILAFQVFHSLYEYIVAVVGEGFHGFDRGHGKFLSYWSTKRLVPCRISHRKHAWHKLSLVRHVKDTVESRL